MTFVVGQRVRILAEPDFADDPPKGSVATVTGHYGDVVLVRFTGGEGGFADFELELAQ